MPSNPLPPNPRPLFVPDYPGAIVYPADDTNFYRPNFGPVFHPPNRPRAWVLHTPEEDADDNEVTPVYFSGPNRQASTIYYLDNDADVFQLMPESCMPFANGVNGKPWPAWADPTTNLNWQTLNVEIEGRASTIHQTMPVGGVQWQALIRLLKHRDAFWKIPLDREHHIGHYQVSIDRSDPGPNFPWDALIRDLQEDPPMIPYNKTATWFTNRTIDQGGPYSMLARSDFSLPATATRVRFGVYVDACPGYLRFFNAGGDEAEPAGWGVKPMFATVEATMRDDGSIPFQVEDGPVSIAVLRSLGYWTS